MKFYDRESEISILLDNERQSENNATFTVLTGRRRVGKTSLVTKALEGRQYAYLFISKDSEAVLCSKFQQAIEEQLGIRVYGRLTSFRDFFEVVMKESLHRHFTIIFDEIMNRRDEYFILADFDSYVKAQEEIERRYKDKKLWNKMCLVNIANSSFFTSDRTIKSYAEEIWHLEKVK